MKDQQAPRLPQVQKKSYNQPGTRPPGIDRRQSTGFQKPVSSLPEKKTQPGPQGPVEPKTTPPSRIQGSSNPTTPPTENQRPGIQIPGRNANGLPINGNGSAKNGFSTNGSGLPVNGNGSSSNGNGLPANGHGTPTNGNGTQTNERNGKGPGANGTNGHTPRSSLFGPGAFTNMPPVQIPPKAGGPAQKPPTVTQIPMEISQRPDDEPRRSSYFRNETTSQPPSQTVPPAPGPQKPSPASPSVSGLDQFLKQNPNLPRQSAVFGVCDDGLPVLLNLQDPDPGAVVVIGDDREAQLEFLRTAVTSIVKRNSPRSVQFLVFSCEPDSWKKWVAEKGFDRHLLTIENADEGQLREWILRLADWTEQRRLGQSSGPAVILVMDTLSFLSQLEYDVRLNFDWMAKEGPAAQIWPLAVISTNLAKALSGRRMLRGFKTRIIGYASQPADIAQLANVDPQQAETLGKRGEFAVKVGENWLKFKLPGK